MWDIAGSIVVYKNSLGHIQEAMSSFLNTQLNVRLYVIDNSPDEHARELCHDQRVVYIHNGRNLGYGGAQNIALRKSVGTAVYHLVMNPDIYFNTGVLEKLYEFTCSRPDIGLIMPMVLNPDGTVQHLCKRVPTPSDLVLRRFLPRIFKPLVKDRMAEYELRDQDCTKRLSVVYLSGCFMMINCEALSRVGYFDERFFMYFEDLDLCRRIHRQFRTIYFPDVAIYHHYGKESYKTLRLLSHHVVSAFRYFHKWGWISDHERSEINRTLPCEIE